MWGREDAGKPRASHLCGTSSMPRASPQQRQGGIIKEDDTSILGAQGHPVPSSHQKDHCYSPGRAGHWPCQSPVPRPLLPEGSLLVGAAIVVNILAAMEAVVSSGVRRWPGPGQKYLSVTVPVSRRHMNSTPEASKILTGPRLRTDGPDTKLSVQSQRAGRWAGWGSPALWAFGSFSSDEWKPCLQNRNLLVLRFFLLSVTVCRMYRAAPCVCFFYLIIIRFYIIIKP